MVFSSTRTFNSCARLLLLDLLRLLGLLGLLLLLMPSISAQRSQARFLLPLLGLLLLLAPSLLQLPHVGHRPQPLDHFLR
jgi:hypothetical protein